MTIFRFSFLFGLLAFAPAVSATTPVGTPIHRFVLLEGLKQLCDGTHDAQCSGYIMATIDTANSIRVAQSQTEVVCPADGVTDDQLLTTVKAVLAKTDAPSDYGASTFVLTALAKAYPCK